MILEEKHYDSGDFWTVQLTLPAKKHITFQVSTLGSTELTIFNSRLSDIEIKKEDTND